MCAGPRHAGGRGGRCHHPARVEGIDVSAGSPPTFPSAATALRRNGGPRLVIGADGRNSQCGAQLA